MPPSYIATPSPGSTSRWPHQTGSFDPSIVIASEFSTAPAPQPMESTSVPMFTSNIPLPLPTKTPSPQSNVTSSQSPVAIGTFPTEAAGPTNVGTPSDMGRPVVSTEIANVNTNPANTVSAATITGISLGLTGVFMVVIVSFRKLARKADLPDATPEENP